MNLRTGIICFAIFFLALPVAARNHSDVIVMKNGDRLTGEIKGVDSGVLYLDLDYIDGTVSIEWSGVARVESNQLFIVKTQDGSVYSGTLRSLGALAGEPLVIQVTDQLEHEVAKLARSRIVTVDETSDSFWRRFNGALNFGTMYTKGNQSTQYNLGSQIEYLRERWKAGTNFSSSLSSSNGAETSARNQLGLGVQRLLPRRNYFYGGLGNFLQSSEQGIRLQTNIGAGIGRYLKNSNRARISVLAGMAWQSTEYRQSTVPLARQNVTAAIVASELKAFAFKKTNLSLTVSVFPALSEPGRVYVDTNASYYIKLFGNLSWNVTFYGNWDNQPPRQFSGSDYGSSSGLSWTFGNR